MSIRCTGKIPYNMHSVDFLLFFCFAQRVIVQNVSHRPLAALENVILEIRRSKEVRQAAARGGGFSLKQGQSP